MGAEGSDRKSDSRLREKIEKDTATFSWGIRTWTNVNDIEIVQPSYIYEQGDLSWDTHSFRAFSFSLSSTLALDYSVFCRDLRNPSNDLRDSLGVSVCVLDGWWSFYVIDQMLATEDPLDNSSQDQCMRINC